MFVSWNDLGAMVNFLTEFPLSGMSECTSGYGLVDIAAFSAKLTGLVGRVVRRACDPVEWWLLKRVVSERSAVIHRREKADYRNNRPVVPVGARATTTSSLPSSITTRFFSLLRMSGLHFVTDCGIDFYLSVLLFLLFFILTLIFKEVSTIDLSCTSEASPIQKNWTWRISIWNCSKK